MVAAAIRAGVELQPSLDLADYLRSAANRLRMEQAYVDQLPEGLYPFQRLGAAFLHGNPTAFLFDEMGLGKTPQALAAIERGSPGMVVCPAGLRLNWKREAERWRPDIEPIIYDGSDAFAWPNPGQLAIVSYGQVPPDLDKYGKPAPETCVAADEAHYVKHYGSNRKPIQRTRRFRMLTRRILKADGCVWPLTGTPVLNRPAELWALLQALQMGPKLYRTHSRFIKLFGGVTDDLGTVRWDPTRIDDDAMEPLRGYVLRRKRADVLKDMPPKSRVQYPVQLTYPKDLKELLDDTADEYADMLTIAAQSAEESLEYFGGIEQLATARKLLATAKIPALLEIVEAYRQAEEPLVVFSAHTAPVEALGQLSGWGTVSGSSTNRSRQKTVDRFQAGELEGLACTIGAAGLGYTMTRAATAVFVDQMWTPAQNEQAEDRLARISQTRPVSIINMVADHKLDQMIAEALARKLNTISRTTEQLNVVDDGRKDRLQLATELDRIAALIPSADDSV